MNSRTIPLTAAAFLIALSAYGAGMWTTYKDWAPWQITIQAHSAYKSWRKTGRVLRTMTFDERREGTPDVFYSAPQPDKIADGLLAVTHMDPKTLLSVVDLIDTQGKTLFTWTVDYSKLVPGGEPDTFVHASHLLPDGSLLVNFDDGHALARLNSCSEPVWVRNDKVYHHSISPGANGFWTWVEPNWNGGQNQFLTEFNPETGDIVKQISMIDDVILASPENATALTIPEGFEFTRESTKDSIPETFHPNDIEELTPEMAPAFPQFRAGDLLVSLRRINMLAVLDQDTHKILWHQYGPWRSQHDPDFQPDGTITVFSNNNERGFTTIIQVDPKTNEAHDIFLGSGLRFETMVMGKHQNLPNGNWLITSAIEGRVMEVTADGQIVREINNVLDERYNLAVSSAEFLPQGYLKEMPSCTK